MKTSTFKTIIAAITLASISAVACRPAASADTIDESPLTPLRRQIQQIADETPAQVGVAIIAPDGDTITIGNSDDYPLMSVFKLHQALGVAHALDSTASSLNSTISIARSELDLQTWSPMLKEHSADTICLSIDKLLCYTLQQSDNNASNILFDRFFTVNECDKFIRTATGIQDFRLAYTEHQMQTDHSRANDNHSSPLACARLINMVFTDSIVSEDKQHRIQEILLECMTGTDRIAAPLIGETGVRLAHKTGSGYRTPEGILKAHNDVGRVTLPDGRTYTLAVLVKDFHGDETQASQVIAKISSMVYAAFKTTDTERK